MPDEIKQEIKQGQVQIIKLPSRGRKAVPIPDEEIAPVIEALEKVAEDDEGVSTGRFFSKRHQAVSYGTKLRDEIVRREARFKERIGTSVVPLDPDKKEEGPFVVAVRMIRTK